MSPFFDKDITVTLNRSVLAHMLTLNASPRGFLEKTVIAIKYAL